MLTPNRVLGYRLKRLLQHQFRLSQRTKPQRLLSWVVVFCLTVAPDYIVGQDQRSDLRAKTLLLESLAAAGGEEAVGKIHDFVGTGEVAYYWAHEAVKGDVSVRGLGLHQFRMDASLPDGLHSSIVNGRKSYRKTPNGNISLMSSEITVKVASATFPWLQLLNAVQDKSISMSSEGVVVYEGREAFDILIQKAFAENRDPLGALSRVSRTHVYIDPKSLVVRGIRDTAYVRDEGGGGCPDEMQFSNYQVVDGVLAPLSITEMIAGQRTVTIQLRQITFNTGLTNADFE
jgi:hypothetical protein